MDEKRKIERSIAVLCQPTEVVASSICQFFLKFLEAHPKYVLIKREILDLRDVLWVLSTTKTLSSVSLVTDEIDVNLNLLYGFDAETDLTEPILPAEIIASLPVTISLDLNSDVLGGSKIIFDAQRSAEEIKKRGVLDVRLKGALIELPREVPVENPDEIGEAVEILGEVIEGLGLSPTSYAYALNELCLSVQLWQREEAFLAYTLVLDEKTRVIIGRIDKGTLSEKLSQLRDNFLSSGIKEYRIGALLILPCTLRGGWKKDFKKYKDFILGEMPACAGTADRPSETSQAEHYLYEGVKVGK